MLKNCFIQTKLDKKNKDYLNRRSKDAETSEVSEVENGDPLQGSAEPFDALVNSKVDPSPTKNGKKVPSPIPDDSDAENNADDKNDDNKSEVNGDSAESTDNGTGTATGDDEEEAYEVEDIVGHKFKGKKKLFRIRWKNYDASADTWEAEDGLSCPEILERYLAEHTDAAKEPKEKKVRISLPPSVSSRTTPKRTAAERKVIIDDGNDGSSEEKKSKSKKSKLGRPKGKKQEEYEVEKAVDGKMIGGKKHYRIRWKGWSAKDDTWEPKASLSCPDKIRQYESSKTDNEDYEVEKIVGEKIEYGKRYFLIKWKGWPESDNTWQAHDEVSCYDLIEKFRDSCRSNKSNKRSASISGKASKAKKARKNASDSDEIDDNDDDDDEEDAEKEWEVDKIVNFRKKGNKKEFLIRWKGCKAVEDTWEPEDGINCPELISAFMKKNKKSISSINIVNENKFHA